MDTIVDFISKFCSNKMEPNDLDIGNRRDTYTKKAENTHIKK